MTEPDLTTRFKALQADHKQKKQSLYDTTMNNLSSLNVGIARTLGLPGTIQKMTENAGVPGKILNAMVFRGSELPTGEEVQQKMADWGMTWEPGEEPQDLTSRIYQEVGSSVFLAGPLAAVAKIKNVNRLLKATTEGIAHSPAASYVPAAAEMISAAGSAVGGKVVESTAWGKDNPEAARAVGELAGGMGTPLGIDLVKVGGKLFPLPLTLFKGAKNLKEEGVSKYKTIFQGAGAKRRAANRLYEATSESTSALNKIKEMTGTEPGKLLTATQASRDRGLASLGKAVEEEVPAILEAATRQRSKATVALRKMVLDFGEPEDARDYLDTVFAETIQKSDDALSKIAVSSDPAAINTKIKKYFDSAYGKARQAESAVWQKLPKEEGVVPSNTLKSYREELDGITEGGDIKEIDDFIKQKLGVPGKKGVLEGGELINSSRNQTSAKAMHQFYSRLGRKVQELRETAGQTNKIRVLNKIRTSILQDLDESAVGDDYKAAIALSRDLNNKFTTGEIGKMMGFQRGLGASPARAFDDIFKASKQELKEAIDQAQMASPEAVGEIKNFVKARFAESVINDKNGRVHVAAGEKFLKNQGDMLDLFPGLKEEITEAVRTQADVDDFLGVGSVKELSPSIKEKSAAGLYLSSDPGTEMATIIGRKNKRGQLLDDLVSKAKQDPTGKAVKGLQSAFTDELLKYSKMTLEDEVTGGNFISGRRFLGRLEELGEASKKAGLFSKKELANLKQIGKAFKGIENDLKAQALRGGVLDDMPAKMLMIPAKVLAARAGGQISKGTMGGSLQTANIFASNADDFVKHFTNDDARTLLIKAAQDDTVMKDLFANLENLRPEEQLKIWSRLKRWGSSQVPKKTYSAKTPVLLSGQSATGAVVEDQEAEDRLRRFKTRSPK